MYVGAALAFMSDHAGQGCRGDSGLPLHRQRMSWHTLPASSPPCERTGMADEAEADELAEETQQVIEALKQVTKIEDPVARAAAISEVLAYVDRHAPAWREDRRKVVLGLRSQKVSYRRIAKMIKVSLGTVQSIERGHAGAWGTKPRTKAKAKTEIEPQGD